MYTINTQIEPDQQEPLKQYLDDTHILLVGETIGQLGLLQIAQFEMTTDTTLLPWKETKEFKGSFLR